MSKVLSQPYCRVYNFSPGPCTLPVEVLEEARDGLLNWHDAGMSVMEMSHRGKAFEGILAEAKADLSALLGIPDNYHILFLQGGASMQNTMVPMNFLLRGQTADYVVTGAWGKKSEEAANLLGSVHIAYSGKPQNYSEVPDLQSLEYSADPAYIHFTSNETIQGVEFQGDPALKAPVVCDMSSDILSRRVDISKYALIYGGAQKNMGPAGVTVIIIRNDMIARVPENMQPMLDYKLKAPVVCDMSSDILSRRVDISKYALIYGGAQKNMGPAGVTVVIIRNDMIARVPENMQPMLDYKLMAENDSLYNTPPCWGIYMCGLVYKWVRRQCGVEQMNKQAKERARLLYDAIDNSGGFYKGHAAKNCRSIMNVTFTLPSDELTDKFVKEAKTQELDGLKGHRSVGGCRASIYNAFPIEGCELLAGFMRDFQGKNG